MAAVSRKYTEITVGGKNDPGRIENVTTLLFEHGVTIEDLDQAVRGVFRIPAADSTCLPP